MGVRSYIQHKLKTALKIQRDKQTMRIQFTSDMLNTELLKELVPAISTGTVIVFSLNMRIMSSDFVSEEILLNRARARDLPILFIC